MVCFPAVQYDFVRLKYLFEINDAVLLQFGGGRQKAKVGEVPSRCHASAVISYGVIDQACFMLVHFPHLKLGGILPLPSLNREACPDVVISKQR